jgi:hypothetical protein
MQDAAKNDPNIAKRVKLFEHRVLEEFYDFEKDPDGLNNLIHSPEHRMEIFNMRMALRVRMVATKDPALEAFNNLNDPVKLDDYMESLSAKKR